MPRPLVSLLTDFGDRDPSAAICRAVIVGIAPDARILDISHEVRKFAIRDGALLLWSALPWFPIGIHVGVVDPGVGTERRPIAIRVERGDVLVGPDNGLLLPAATRLGGIVSVVELANPAFRLSVVSASFHGRDIFSPAAAYLATGVAFEDLGPSIDPSTLVDLRIPEPVVGDGVLESAVVYVDTFGNVKLAGTPRDLETALGAVESGQRLALAIQAQSSRTVGLAWRGTFGDAAPGELLAYEDSYGRLCVAVNQGDAGATLDLHDDDRVTIRRASTG